MVRNAAAQRSVPSVARLRTARARRPGAVQGVRSRCDQEWTRQTRR
jgi:hypothetical protein